MTSGKAPINRLATGVPGPDAVLGGQPSPGTENASALAGSVEGLREELFRLRRDIAQVQMEFDDTKAAKLLQANEKLVVAAMEADRIVHETALRLNELTQSTQRDTLTDTPNRSTMVDRLQSAIAMALRRESSFAVLFVDVDRFKEVNDTLGHAAGDEVLQVVARRLEGVVRASDTVSRHGGDEFVVLLTEISDAADAALVAEKMLQALQAPAGVQLAPALTLSASIGIAIFPQDADDAAGLVSTADEAMYRAKRSGGGAYRFHQTLAGEDETNGPSADERQFEHAPDPRDLREVNEQLIMSSLALQASEARAVIAHQQQIKFLAMVTHELRGPLAPIRSAAELLQRVRVDEAQHARVRDMIQRQVSHMARIVDDLLDGSRALTGKFHLEPVEMDLADVLRLAMESCRPAMDMRMQHLKPALPSGPLWMLGDPVRLGQVFQNLLDNASKYTQSGGIISIAVVNAPHTVMVSVADNGIGIAAEVLPRVFDLFAQDSRAVSFHGFGLGIGLAVVRELVEAHGGRITVSSRGPDLGSEFIVTLPCRTVGPR